MGLFLNSRHLNGIVLNTTGSSGGLTVTGDGGTTNNASGGTIQNTTGAGVLLNTTRDVSFDQLNLTSTGGSGVQGTLVTNFTHTNSTFTNAGNAFRGGPACLNRFSASLSGTSAGVRLPSGGAAW